MRSQAWRVLQGCLGLLLLTATACSGPAQQTRQAPPPPSDGSEQGGGAAALTSEQLEEVQRTVRVGQEAIIACYEEEMERQKNSKLTGKLMVKIMIGTAGKAQDVEIMKSTFNSPAMDNCVVLTIKSWDFPRLPGVTPFTYPYEFSPAY